MTGPESINVARQRRRLMTMVAIDAVCVLIALASIVGDLSFHIGWLAWPFAAAVITGFAAQIWLIAGLMKR